MCIRDRCCAFSFTHEVQCVVSIKRCLYQLLSIDCTDEWKVYSVDDIPRSWYCVEDSTEDASCDAANDRPYVHPIDQYWAKVMAIRTAAGDLKYKTLGKVLLAGLALSHGNADAERGFSVN